MFCFGAFGDVPDEDVAIVACRQHYPAVKGMGLQHKHFICMALQWKTAHLREKGKSTTEPKACAVLSGKLNPRQPQRFQHSKGKNSLDSSKSCRNMKLLPKDGELFNGWVTAQEFYLFHIYLFFCWQGKSKSGGSSKFWLKEFQGTPHLLYHPYRALSSNYKFSMHMSLQFQENLPKARKIPYHQVMEQLPCAGIPNFEQVIIHSRNNIVVILVPGYHGYFRLHEFVFFCTSVTIWNKSNRSEMYFIF